jgi:hypothetical protein
VYRAFLNKREIEVLSNVFYSHRVLSGFNIMFDRQRQTKYSVSNDMARVAKGGDFTRVDDAPSQE